MRICPPIRNPWTLGLVTLLSDLRAQSLPAVQDGAALEQAYRAVPPFSALTFTREERNGVVVFVEKTERQDLNYLLSVRTHLARCLREHLQKSVLEPAGVGLGARPVVLWLLKDPDSFQRAGGRALPQAGYDATLAHTLNYAGTPGAEARELHACLVGCALQILDQAQIAGNRVAWSDWLRYGLAHHFATIPADVPLLTVPPKFGRVFTDQIASLASSVAQRCVAQKQDRLERMHHPLAVIGFARFDEYLTACNVHGDARTDQAAWYTVHCDALVAFWDRAHQGAFRDQLTTLIKAEAAGKRCFDAFAVAQPAGEERQTFLLRFAEFVRRPREVLTTDLKGYASAESQPAVAAPAPTAEPPLPAVETPPTLLVARALKLAAVHEPARALEVLGETPGPAADRARILIGKARELVERFNQEVSAGKRPTIYLPDPQKPRDSALFQVVAIKPGGTELELERKPQKMVVPFAGIGPHLLAEALDRQKVALDVDAKAAVGTLTRIFAAGRPDEREILARAKARGFVADATLVDGLAAPITALREFERTIALAREPEGAAKAGTALDALLKNVPAELARALLIEHWTALWQSGAFLGEVLRGKASRLQDGRTRITYSWEETEQLQDWILLEPGGDFPTQVLGTGRGTPQVADTCLTASGPVLLRHRLQFGGEVQVTALAGTARDESGRYVISRDPGVGVLAQPDGTALWLFANGVVWIERRGDVLVEREDATGKHWDEVWPLILKEQGVTLTAKDKVLQLRIQDKQLFKVPAPDFLPASGAVLIAFSGLKMVGRCLLDRLVVTGMPDPESLAGLGRRWARSRLERIGK